jgi:hypothetical protein
MRGWFALALLAGLLSGQTLEQTLREERGPAWIGYWVEDIAVLYRVTGGRVDRIRCVSLEGVFHHDGFQVRWLRGISASESAALLASIPETKGALAALAQHRDAGEVEALVKLARTHTTSRVRSDALFWLAHRAGEKAAASITEALEEDPDTEVKKHAVFALSQLPKEESVRLLLQVARTNRNPEVRRRAIFWLGQSRDPRALDYLEEILGTARRAAP